VRSADVSAPGAPLSIELPRATSLRVSVPGLAEEPAPATMSISGPGGTPFVRSEHFGSPRTEWRVGPETVVERLPPGPWVVTVRAADGRVFRGTAETGTGGIAEVVLE
jgi:hypothetical protein